MKSESSFKDKTLFRFPLRNKQSKLSSKIWSIDGVQKLIESLKAEAKYLLLFLQCVTSIKIVKITPSERYSLLFKVSATDDDVERISQQKLSLCRRVKATFPTGCEPQVICDISHFSIKLLNKDSTTSSHEWIIVNQIGSEDSQVRALAKSQAVLPWVGTAFELTASSHYEDGHIFCFLPLPVEDHAPFAVHVHGTFAVSSNRRALKWESQER